MPISVSGVAGCCTAGDADLHNDISVTRGINHLLDALSSTEDGRTDRALSPVFFSVDRMIYERGRPIDSVYFPLNCVISLVTPVAGGAMVEVATVGNEGMIGVPLVPGGSAAARAITQMAGWCVRMDAPAFLEALDRQAPVRALVDGYLNALLLQVTQTAACNRLHSDQQRLSRWLLMSHDRAGRDLFDLSRSLLAQLLGVQAISVGLSVGILEASGLIRYRHGELTIIDRDGLESRSCECYGAIRRELDRVVRASDLDAAAGGRLLSGAGRRGRRVGHPVPS